MCAGRRRRKSGNGVTGRSKVDTPADVVKQVAKAGADKRETLLLLVHRDGNDRFVAIKLSQA